MRKPVRLPSDEAVGALIARLYDAALEPEVMPAVLEDLGDMFQGSAVRYGTAIRVRGVLSRDMFKGAAVGYGAGPVKPRDQLFCHWDVRFDPYYTSRFYERFFTEEESPFLASLPRLPVGRPIVKEAFTDPRAFRRSALYREIFAPQKFWPALACALERTDDLYSVMILFREERKGQYHASELRLLQTFTPHLTRALQIHRRLAAAIVQRDAALEVVDHMAHGVFLVDRDGKVVFANRRAEAIARERDGLAIWGGELRADSCRQARALRHLIRSAACGAPGVGGGAGGAMALDRPSLKRPLAVLVAPLRHRLLASGGTAPAAAVFVTDPERGETPPHEILMRLYGLSWAEARLAALVAEGHGLPDIADRLGLSRNTVHTQLHAIFAKTGTHRQSELVRLILKSPAGLRLIEPAS